jgi:hypothetical protein
LNAYSVDSELKANSIESPAESIEIYDLDDCLIEAPPLTNLSNFLTHTAKPVFAPAEQLKSAQYKPPRIR